MNPPPAATAVDVLVLGAGAAGLMCALTAGKRGKSVVLVERVERIGKKILVSGGGRCNFTNLHATADNYVSGQPDFCRSALARYGPADFIALVEAHAIAYHEKKLGQLFCDGSSREIVGMLAAECRDAGVRTHTNCEVGAVSREADGGFRVETARGPFRAGALVVATGGIAWPQLGGSDLAYRLARQFGLRVVPPRPGLVPLTFQGETLELCAELSGVALPCAARAGGARTFRENLLFTHRGLSGPAVLQVSSYLPPADDLAAEVVFDLLPDAPGDENWLADAHRRGEDAPLARVLSERLPTRVAQTLARPAGQPAPVAAVFTQGARRAGTHPAALVAAARRHGGLSQGRGDAGRGRHARTARQDHAGPPRAGPVFHRRGRGCHGPARRIQLPVGLGPAGTPLARPSKFSPGPRAYAAYADAPVPGLRTTLMQAVLFVPGTCRRAPVPLPRDASG